MTLAAEITAHLAWRYATNECAATRKISAETWAVERHSLEQTRNSFGLFHFPEIEVVEVR